MEQTYQISGMTCDHCAMHVREALEGLAGVKSARVDLETGKATVVADSVLDVPSVAAAVDEVGYKLVPQSA